MKQIVSNYSYTPSTNVVTLTGVNIDQDQLLLVVAPQVGRTMYNFASGVTGVVSAGADTRITLNASTAGLTTTSPLVIFYDDQTSTHTIAGTVTANVVGRNANYTSGVTAFELPVIGFDETIESADAGIVIPVQITNNLGSVGGSNSLPISGTVTANVFGYSDNESSYQPIPVVPWDEGVNSGRSVVVKVQQEGVGSIPISGTVTANNLPVKLFDDAFDGGNVVVAQLINAEGEVSVANPLGVYVSNPITVGSCVTHGVNVANSVTIASLPAISGTVTANLSSVPTHGVTIANTSVTVNGTFYQATQPVSLVSLPSLAAGTAQIGSVTASISGTVPVSISSVTIGNTVTVSQSGSVTIGSLPSGALTTRFGSVTTANTAQITSAVTNNSRKYLLAQNISAGTVTIGIGFSPTTTQGIQLAGGAGITFDAFCPTGAVYWLGATTGAAFTILEG